MSDHFRHSLKVIGAVVVILLGAFIWLKRKAERAISIPQFSASPGLRSDERELVRFDERTHRVSVVTSSGTVKTYARNPTVRIRKDGKIVVDRHLLGLELRPFIGIGYSDTTRAMVGVQPAYWGAFDAAFALGVSMDRQYIIAKPYAGIGYNCWGNLSVDAGVNPMAVRDLDFILFLSVKI